MANTVTDASPVAIPEIIAGRISAPVPVSYLKWQFPRRSRDVPDEILERKSLSSLLYNQPCFFTVCLQQWNLLIRSSRIRIFVLYVDPCYLWQYHHRMQSYPACCSGYVFTETVSVLSLKNNWNNVRSIQLVSIIFNLVVGLPFIDLFLTLDLEWFLIPIKRRKKTAKIEDLWSFRSRWKLSLTTTHFIYKQRLAFNSTKVLYLSFSF